MNYTTLIERTQINHRAAQKIKLMFKSVVNFWKHFFNI